MKSAVVPIFYCTLFISIHFNRRLNQDIEVEVEVHMGSGRLKIFQKTVLKRRRLV